MENNITPPLFANRYRLETVTSDWDRGRSGYTHLVYDTQTNRKAVIKRADVTSPQAVQGLKNEVDALKILREFGVPDVYETGETSYGSKKFTYVVIEYVDALRVEKYLNKLSADERAEILIQLFGLLTEAHRQGIVNGDLDLKHLFWRQDKKQLIVIDWGNSKIGVDPKKNIEFAYDFARSAEIIYALVTISGHPPATGSLALPKDSALQTKLLPLPVEFYKLCRWAPRAPSDGAQSPFNSLELLEISKRWLAIIGNKETVKHGRRTFFGGWMAGILIFAIMAYVLAAKFIYPVLSSTPTPSSIEPVQTTSLKPSPILNDTPEPSETPLLVLPLTQTPEPVIPTKTTIPTDIFTIAPTIITPTIIPSPGAYSQLLNFDNKVITENCWENKTDSATALSPQEGFSRREDQYWRFFILKERTAQNYVQADFSKCLGGQHPKAIAINVWMARLEVDKEIGFFIEEVREDKSVMRREYVLWVDSEKTMRLRLLENGEIVDNSVVLIVNPAKFKSAGVFPHPYYQFPIKIFLEINNSGLDILYMGEGPLQEAVSADSLDANKMIRVSLVRPTLNNIAKIGLVGYGGETQVVIWPLIFFGE